LHVDVVIVIVIVFLLPEMVIIVFYIWQRWFPPVIIQALNLKKKKVSINNTRVMMLKN